MNDSRKIIPFLLRGEKADPLRPTREMVGIDMAPDLPLVLSEFQSIHDAMRQNLGTVPETGGPDEAA